MKKFFSLPVRLSVDTIECDEFAYATTSCEYIVDGIDIGEAIVEAINKYDQHVERITELEWEAGSNDYLYEVVKEKDKRIKELEKAIDRAIKESNFYIQVSEDDVMAKYGLRTITELLEKTK